VPLLMALLLLFTWNTVHSSKDVAGNTFCKGLCQVQICACDSSTVVDFDDDSSYAGSESDVSTSQHNSSSVDASVTVIQISSAAADQLPTAAVKAKNQLQKAAAAAALVHLKSSNSSSSSSSSSRRGDRGSSSGSSNASCSHDQGSPRNLQHLDSAYDIETACCAQAAEKNAKLAVDVMNDNIVKQQPVDDQQYSRSLDLRSVLSSVSDAAVACQCLLVLLEQAATGAVVVLLPAVMALPTWLVGVLYVAMVSSAESAWQLLM
jgi:hypothetical protein